MNKPIIKMLDKAKASLAKQRKEEAAQVMHDQRVTANRVRRLDLFERIQLGGFNAVRAQWNIISRVPSFHRNCETDPVKMLMLQVEVEDEMSESISYDLTPYSEDFEFYECEQALQEAETRKEERERQTRRKASVLRNLSHLERRDLGFENWSDPYPEDGVAELANKVVKPTKLKGAK